MTTINSRIIPSIGTIWRNGFTAAIVAAIGNGLLFLVGSALGGFPSNVLTSMGTPITLTIVLIMSIALILIGTLVYTLLWRFVANPNRWFTILALVVLVIMLYGPFTLPNPPLLMNLLLQLMHLLAGGSALYFLRRS